MKNLLLVSMSRADYWLMKSLFLNFIDNDDFKISFLISRQLLDELRDENITEFKNIKMLNNIEIIDYQYFENSVETFLSIQREFSSFTKVKQYDLIIVLGDRFETLAIAQIAFLHGIEIAHISGGETTFGSKDNEFRKCISLYSKIHFPAKKSHAIELAKIGIDMKNMKIVGYLAIDNINMFKARFQDRRNLFAKLGISTDYEISVVTYHPNTKKVDQNKHELGTMIEFMESIKNKFFVITAANKDDGGKEINDTMQNWALNNPQRSKFFYHLGSLDYFNLLIHANCLIGNSSSGLTEAAILNVPVVNIGDRQLGRHKEGNVHDCDFVVDEITKQYWIATRKLSENSQGKVDNNLISPSKLIIGFLKDYFRKDVS